jgi:hypothetical protein
MCVQVLKLVMVGLPCALLMSASYGQTCCPAGCTQKAERCVATGPPWTKCTPIACADEFQRVPSGRSPDHNVDRHTGGQRASVLRQHASASARPPPAARNYVAPPQIPPQCPLLNPTKAQLDEATSQCVNALTEGAQRRDCFFEDDAGRAEDKRTGKNCLDRQAVLAKQCLKRCVHYASDRAHLVCAGSYPNTLWRNSFGDISGESSNSARVDLCGPPLKSQLTGDRGS